MNTSTSLLLLLSVLISSVLPAVVEKKDRVIHGRPLSDKPHHLDDGEMDDHDYDHDAFLGDDVADDYDNLSPEESQRRLALIVDKIDANTDGKVSVEELQQWIKFSQQRYVGEDVERQWGQHAKEEEDVVVWEEYRQTIYGFIQDDEEEREPSGFSYAQMEARDERRWRLADGDHDGKLTKAEFQDFLHPEDADHMRDIVVTETIEDIDKDGDGMISMNEYIGDMYHADSDDDLEPDWVTSEKEQFKEYRDKNGDGFMDAEEVKAWIVPQDFDHSEAEAKHLVYESDVDGDGELTKEEVLEKYDLFVGSQATDFGEALSRHDEF